MGQFIHLRSLYPKRDAAMLAVSLVCGGLLHGWGQSLGIVGGIVFSRRLLLAWSWKCLQAAVRQTIEQRLPELQIVNLERSFNVIRYREDWGVTHHPIECRNPFGEPVHVNAVTGGVSGRVERVQARRPSEIYQDV